MKIRPILAAAMSVLVMGCASRAGQTCDIGLPSTVNEAARPLVFKAVTDVLLTARPGTRVRVFDAWAQVRICDVTVTGTSKRGRIKKLARVLAAIKRHFARKDHDPAVVEDQIRVPAFLAMLRRIRNPDSSMRIVLFGSLYHGDPQDPHTTFAPGFVPSDGVALASTTECVFGTADIRGSMNGGTVDWCYLGANGSTLERRAVTRFWTIYFSELGMSLTSVLHSPELTVESAMSGATEPAFRDHIDRSDRRIEIRPVEGPPQETSVPPAPEVSISPERLQLEQTAALVPAPRQGFLSIAAIWTSADGSADVDLWVRPNSQSEELYFGHTAIAEGRYLRDIRTSHTDLNTSRSSAAWEAVELSAARVANVSCWLNLYVNSGQEVKGLVRIHQGEVRRDVPFQFMGTGDSASGRLVRAGDRNWIRIDVAEHLQ